jgi:hypothetical protein
MDLIEVDGITSKSRAEDFHTRNNNLDQTIEATGKSDNMITHETQQSFQKDSESCGTGWLVGSMIDTKIGDSRIQGAVLKDEV